MMFPEFDPVALQIGPIAIRWYALSYIVGILLAWRYCIWQAQLPPQRVSRTQLDDLMFWVHHRHHRRRQTWAKCCCGSRVATSPHPLEILKIWEGGMAFHGGLIGVIVAILLYARSQKLSPFAFSDVIAASTPIGLFLGRVANFVNGELPGRPTDVPWAFIFPQVDMQPRHPSQLYQAALEGILLFIVLHWAGRQQADPRAARHDDRPVPDRLCDRALDRRGVPRAGGQSRRLQLPDLGADPQPADVPVGLYLVMRKPRVARDDPSPWSAFSTIPALHPCPTHVARNGPAKASDASHARR